MNFQQLRIVRETVRQGFNLTEVANALFTSQSGVSKHIKDLEDELGVELFVRRGRRVLALTEPGQELLQIVERLLLDAGNIKRLAEQFNLRDSGQLTIATTHTQARYALPPVVAGFRQAYPKVHLVLHQASPEQLVRQLLAGEADIGIATDAVGEVAELVSFPYYSWRHCVIAPPDHPLHRQPLTLRQLARYPIVTYHGGFTGRSAIDQAFAEAGCAPDIVMTALDADVIKTYVELGLAVGIVARMAVDTHRDAGVRVVAGPELFAEQHARIALRRGHYLRSYALRFIQLCVPGLDEQQIRAALAAAPDPLASLCA
ncbi:MAG: CysB family HTH-type transcriptional regulator [Paludibacterium sp.]|uniref:CysB family HTH-type transcriptional regulator n=1 Tax=Paludibacterium sp. TaxID=1917523 RepID=UPI0025FF9C93|nr:CysB family HTH-type transcriptional regulator [Paludibacterium sp.]MBV8046886.1 CysB family HTH-type transcriptional regulator [Paludibacterium sp.]MBV8648354.1 CysB family HTH-type transcriptional regulator [Paludibacterium sp.]